MKSLTRMDLLFSQPVTTSTTPTGWRSTRFRLERAMLAGLRLILLRSAFALRVERHLGDFPVLLAFDLVVRLAVLQSFHRFQTGGAAKIFLRRCADGLRQLIELNGDLRAQHRSVRVGDEELDVLAADRCLHVIDGLSSLDFLSHLIN